jgi:hypothetical protein
MNKLLEFLEDNSGGLSSSRCLMLLWGIVTLGIWAYVSVHTGVLVSIPEPSVTILLGLVGFKTVQRFGEKSDSQSSTETKIVDQK